MSVVFVMGAGLLGASVGIFQGWDTEFYLSQSVIYTSDNQFLGETDDNASFDFWEASVFMAKPFTPELHFASQIAARSAGEIDDGKPDVDFAYLSYSFLQDFNKEAGVRFGRVKVPFGLYNETRDVAFSRPGAILPQSTYAESTKDAFFSRDGVLFYANQAVGDNYLRTHFGVSRPILEDEALFNLSSPEEFFFDAKLNGKLSYNAGAFIDFDLGRSTVGVSFEQLSFETETLLDATFIDENGFIVFGSDLLPEGNVKEDVTLNTLLLSYQLNRERWTFSTEASLFEFDSSEITDEINQRTLLGEALGLFALTDQFEPDDFNTRGRTIYLQNEYKLTQNWTLLTRFDYSEVNFNRFSESFSTTDYTIGVSYMPNKHTKLSLEYHHVKGIDWLDVRENDLDELEEIEEKFDLVIFQSAFRF